MKDSVMRRSFSSLIAANLGRKLNEEEFQDYTLKGLTEVMIYYVKQ